MVWEGNLGFYVLPCPFPSPSVVRAKVVRGLFFVFQQRDKAGSAEWLSFAAHRQRRVVPQQVGVRRRTVVPGYERP